MIYVILLVLTFLIDLSMESYILTILKSDVTILTPTYNR